MATQTKFYKQYETLDVQVLNETIAHLQFNRPKVLNAMSVQFFEELGQFFEDLRDQSIRVVVVSGSGNHFSAGLDLNDAMSVLLPEGADSARKAIKINATIEKLQACISAAEKCPVPVIVATHGHCIGGAIDFMTACDIRICDSTAKFSVKEIDIGMAADIGTLQRLPLVIGSDSFVRDICFTGRTFTPEEALAQGFVSKVYKNKEELLQNAFALAEIIASKSPVAIWAIKKTLNKNKEATVQAGLDYIKILNMSLLFSEDMNAAIQAGFTKKKPVFPKL